MSDFAAAAEAILRARLRDDPVRATWTGLHDYDTEMPDVTADGIEHLKTALASNIATLEAFSLGDLSRDERTDRSLLMSELEVELRELNELQPYQHDPSLYPSLAADAVYSVLAREFAPLRDRLPSVVARMEKIPAMLETAKRTLTRSPRVWTDIAVEETEAAIEFFNDSVAPLFHELRSSAVLGTQARDAMRDTLAALTDYRNFLERTHAQRDGMQFAIGRELFDYKLTHEHFLPYTAQSLLEFGEEAVRLTEFRLQEVAHVIERQTDWPVLLERLRSEALPDSEDLVSLYRNSLGRARDFVVKAGLVSMPEGEILEVVATPLFQRPTTPYAAYMAPGAFDARQLGLYYVTPIDAHASPQAQREQLLGHNLLAMQLTNVHEGYPGHHLQLVIANRAPSLVRRLHDSTVFAEGWALYCEQLVLDEGMDPDPRMRLFQLKDQLWRACRVVIDVKLHTGAMTFDQAVDMLVNVAKLERVNAVGEVRRYTQSPTQPMSYLVGKQQIMDLRERERARLGGAFELRSFHDRLLAQGTIPVALIAPTLANESEG
ncbi:MAG TPA: DUF885 domain-containing protein [Candidatus Eremiobacteraceae bacterium]|nr:DUF885 domain-containing protein [Candidatus Eremiobacteraceae bacterium]